MAQYKPPRSGFPDPDDAAEALEAARAMPPGTARNEALKRAGQMRAEADARRWASSEELKPPHG